MDPAFRVLVDSLHPKFLALLDMRPSVYSQLPRTLPKRAVYLFSEDAAHLYVGRTNRLRERLRGHCVPSATHFTASFAFRIAREQTGFTSASYTKENSRAELVKHELFGPAFTAAKLRIANMSVRFVEESDPVRQALLEIYAATTLKTPFNDFENH